MSSSSFISDDIVTALDDSVLATEDIPVVFSADLLLNNDVTSGAPASDLSIASVESGVGGTAVLNSDGTVTFAPDANFNGVATFTYTARDIILRDVSLGGLAPNQGIVLQATAGDFGGWSVSSAGDLNGDGFSDVIVGAPRGADGDLDGGHSYVVFGQSHLSSLDLASIGSSSAGFVISGNEVGNWAGLSVACAGDVNGDGFSDLIMGAPRSPSGGAAYVVY